MGNKVAYLHKKYQYYKICKKLNETGHSHYEWDNLDLAGYRSHDAFPLWMLGWSNQTCMFHLDYP